MSPTRFFRLFIGNPDPDCLCLILSSPFSSIVSAADFPSSNAALFSDSPSITFVRILEPEFMASFPNVWPNSYTAGLFKTGNKNLHIPFKIFPRPAPL